MTSKSQPDEETKPFVLHVTTSHLANDIRIFEKECKGLAASGKYRVGLAAAGDFEEAEGVSVVPIRYPPRGRVARFIKGPIRAAALTHIVDAQLWHFHDPELLPLAVRMARTGKLVIWDAHEDYVAQLHEKGAKSWVPGPLRRIVREGTAFFLRRIDRHAAGIVAATPTIASRYSNPRTALVGNEARLETFNGCQPTFHSRQVLFTGYPGYGHLFPEVVRAVSMIPDAKLAVAGRTPDTTLWRQAEELLGPRLVHLGWLSRKGIVDAFNDSAIGLSTYADLPTNAENSPNKLFEFGAAGLPVIATPTKSNLRHIGTSKAGVVASGFSAREMAEAMIMLLNDEQAWAACSTSGRQWAFREGSWSKSEQALLALYQTVLRDRCIS